MPNPDEPHEVLSEAARALVGGTGEGIGQRVCRVCGRPLRERQQLCSGKCRAAWSRRKKHEAVAERDRQVRVLLTEALRLLGGVAEDRG